MRYYNPGTGRYITSDPVGLLYDFSNPNFQASMLMGMPLEPEEREKNLINYLYSYAQQNPIKFIDNYGLRPTKNPKGPDGKPIKHSCKKNCVISFIGGGFFAGGAGLAFGAVAGATTIGGLVGYYGSSANSAYSYFSLSNCFKKCEDDDCQK